ncbi:MAG: hypothetical protein ACPG4N_07190 [Gammaproteobacteria bacterium]
MSHTLPNRAKQALLPISLFFAALISVNPVHATVLISDDFTGNSGGMPSSWSFFPPFTAGSATESGTNVTIFDTSAEGPTLITAGSYNPQGSTTTLAVNTTSQTADSSFLVGIADTSVTNILVAQLNADGNFRVFYSNGGPGTGTEEALGVVAGYSGGLMDMIFTFDDDSLRFTADGGAFDTGDIAYTSLSSAFDFSAFGSDVQLAVGMSSGTVDVDSVLFETTGTGLNSGSGGGEASAVPTPAPWLLLLMTSSLIVFRSAQKEK